MRLLRSRILLVLIPLCLAAALLAAACGSDSKSSGPPAGSVGTAVAQQSVPANAPLIDEDNLQFKPGKLTVDAGQVVYFKNSETAIHNVEIDGGNKSPDMKKGEIFSYRFNTAGTYKITCEYHPQMHSTITVK
ncbi:cupredoxin domain-containing protein [bacterium]|nr:cupredoxin domain-containing protein [bacterium]